jgi:hypothetical protein
LRKSSRGSNFQKRRYSTLISRIEKVARGVHPQMMRVMMIIRAITVKTYMVRIRRRKMKERKKKKR